MKPALTLATLSSLVVLAVMHASLRQDIPSPSPLTRTAARATASPRISIPDLLNPETQLATFQKYRIQADEAEAKYLDFGDPASFHKWHSDLRFIPIGTKPHQGYLVSWHSGDDWDATATAKKDPAPKNILFPYNRAEFVIFSEEGSRIAEDQTLLVSGLAADLDGDGSVEEIEYQDFVSGERARSLLTVRPLNRGSKPFLKILYNSHPASQAVGNTWGFQAKGPDQDGLYEIQLGPIRVPQGVEPKVTFHWDKRAHAWIGPKPTENDHYRVLAPEEEDQSAKLSYPLAPAPKWPSDSILGRGPFAEPPVAETSKPYQYHSLANLSDEDLFDFMTASHPYWETLQQHDTDATTVPDFWALPPREAAWQFIHRNRPAETNETYQIGFAVAEGEQPPQEGDLTLSDGPSGCFAPSGASIHHLHCSKKASFLALVESIQYSGPISPKEDHSSHDFRRMEIPYEDARHLLQTIWWLNRARSRQVAHGKSSGIFGSGGSTSDGVASVQLSAGTQSFALEALRSAGFAGTYRALSIVGEDYDTSAFTNLVVQLFQREVPTHLGAPWQALGIKARWNKDRSAPDMQYTPNEIAHLRSAAVSLLDDFRHGALGTSAVIPIVDTIGQMGWKDLRGNVESLASLLPDQLPHEKLAAQMDAELAAWKEKLGADATSESAHLDRLSKKYKTGSAGSIPVIPGLEPISSPTSQEPPPPEPQPTEEEKKFAAFDDLFEKRQSVSFKAPVSDRFIGELRQQIPTTLKYLDLFDDVEGLYRLGTENPDDEGFAITRLVRLNPRRAAEFLKMADARSPLPGVTFYKDTLHLLLDRGPVPLDAERRSGLRATLANNDATFSERTQALQELASTDEPDPAFDDWVLHQFEKPDSVSAPTSSSLASTLAARLGARAWDTIFRAATDNSKPSSLQDYLPALTAIAVREPTPYRAQLQSLIEKELNAPALAVHVALWSAWLLDLRNLARSVERIANNTPEDAESSVSSPARDPSTVRYHLARKIAALWNEEDPSTRTRLLIAFALSQNADLAADNTALKLTTNHIVTAFRSLPPADQNKVRTFTRWCTENAPSKLRGAFSGDLQTITNAIAAALPPE